MFWRYSVFAVSILSLAENVQAESLWLKSTTDEHGMFAQRKARYVGDILTVKIDESLVTKMKVATNQQKTASTFNNPLQLYLFHQLARKYRADITQDKLSSTSQHAADAEVGISDQIFTTTFSVTVIDVLPNKNLVIEGVRCLKFSDQTVFTTLRGLVRSDDVGSDNTVASSKIADMHVEALAEGSLSDTVAKGLLQRANDTINLM
jgi:flagellar L-ring protein precursor FlgH